MQPYGSSIWLCIALAGSQLAATAVHILPRGVAYCCPDSMGVQMLGQRRDMSIARAPIAEGSCSVVRNQVHDCVLSLEQANDAIHLFITVVDAIDKRPLVLDRVAGRSGIMFRQLDELRRLDVRRLG